MSATVDLAYVLTYHGTVLCYDSIISSLTHRPLRNLPARYRPIVVRQQPERLDATSEGPSIEIVEPAEMRQEDVTGRIAPRAGTVNGTVFLAREQGFFTARNNFTVDYGTGTPREWESFVLVPVATMQAIGRLLNTSWRLKPGDILVEPKEMSLGQGFVLHLGGQKLELAGDDPCTVLAEGDLIEIGHARSRDTLTAERHSVARRPLSEKRIWIEPLGNTANRALQYLVAHRIKSEVPDARIENIYLPEWGIERPDQRPERAFLKTGYQRYWLDISGLGAALDNGAIDAIVLNSFPFNIDHLPDRAIARRLIGQTVGGSEARGFGPRDLVCSVRGGEILHGIHGDYIVLPPAYYRSLAERSGLDLVFYGQLGDDVYARSLRDAFPDARFIPGRDPQYDFDMLRRSVNIAPAVSTFAWLAAWLSEAENVFIPVGGMFSPIQHPNQMYLPLDDSAFKFTLLPYSKAVNLFTRPQEFFAQQDLISRCSRPVTSTELTGLVERARALFPQKPYVGGFDVTHYLDHSADVAAQICGGRLTALQHYLDHGHAQGRSPAYVDETAYLLAYPKVAMKIAEGHYVSALDHYTRTGWREGFRPSGFPDIQ